MNAIDQFKQFYRTSSLFIKLIVINTVIFVAVNLIDTFFYFFNSEFSIINWLAVPASFSELIIKPYTIITYMFLHEDVLHILFNMMWLYVFGKIFLEFL
ncbi:MAG TPA: rhomboid family intramembrane serine protease, partial [Bacteroidales bacterium]|nr:rhomboid family intramembrane serine protease [Bacteroidales bacterium]